eukprot:TRINITY_DN940_c0_g1_i1.p1 TRINITY_DN940_c0_g1~~TRINITY_DN940_c0_g1_i1.p1  ORF type:complete len:982 (+),score=204.53 TRINITY_DN940_c0_g1_i1:108-3053(+)
MWCQSSACSQQPQDVRKEERDLEIGGESTTSLGDFRETRVQKHVSIQSRSQSKESGFINISDLPEAVGKGAGSAGSKAQHYNQLLDALDHQEPLPSGSTSCVKSDGAAPTPLSNTGDVEVGDLIQTTVDFRVEMWQSRLHDLKVDMLQSVWRRKVEWALRTGTAILLSGIYSVLPSVQHAEWQHATVFAPVLAIAGVAGPSVGDTLHHCWHFITGAILGSLMGCLINEFTRYLQGEVWRHWVSFLLLNLGNFFLLTRPGAPLGQRRVSTCVLVIAVYAFDGSDYTLDWYWPITVSTPILVACTCSVIAVLIPYPCTALADWHRRAEFQALATRAVIAEQYDSAANCSVASTTAAAQLMEVLVQNLTRMQTLKSALEIELLFNGPRMRNILTVNKLLQGQLNELRSIQSTLNSIQDSESHRAFRAVTNEPWQRFLKAVAAATDEAVSSEGHVSAEMISAVDAASHELNQSCERARREILYKRGSSVRSLSVINGGESLPLEHCQRMAMHFFASRLGRTFACLQDAQQQPRTGCCSWVVKTVALAAMSAFADSDEGGDEKAAKKKGSCCEWFGLPTGDAARGAVKKSLTLAIISILAFIPDLREHFPQYVWAAIAACFIFSDFVGSSVATGLHRISGTLFGGVFGLIAIDILQSYRPGYVVALVIWTLGCALFRSSPTHGYLATVAAFSAPIMMIGALEVDRQDQGEWIVLHRTKMQAIGAAVYVVVENLVWPSSARTTLSTSQGEILETLRVALSDALVPYAADCAEVCCRESIAAKTSETISAGLGVINKCKSLLQPATEEPLYWRNAFPRYHYEQVLAQETRAFRAVAALHAAARAADVAEVPEDARRLIASYAQAADSCLKSAFAEISAPAAARALGLAQSASLRSAASIVAPLLELSRQSQKFQLGMTQYLFRLTDDDDDEAGHGTYAQHTPRKIHSQKVSFSVQTVFFCCLEFNKIVLQLSDQLRAVSSVENSALHI